MSITSTAAVREAFSCCVADSESVEARFGLRNCYPESDDSCCEYALPPWAFGQDGRPRAGAFAVAADHILGEVSFIRRQPGEWSLTTELTLDFVGGLVAPGSVLQVKGSAVRLESKSGFVSGAITDGAGTPVVLATTRIVNVLGEPEMTPPAQPQALIAGSAKIDASLEENLSISYVAGADGLTARLSEPAAWTNGFRILHGGVWACVAEAVASTAVATTNDGLSTAHMHVSYLRPGVPAAGINATADVVHVGGRFALVSVRGYADDGTLCTVASITFRRIEPSIS